MIKKFERIMNSAFKHFGIAARLRAAAAFRNSSKPVSRKFSGGHGHANEPTVPEFHDRLSKGMLVAAYLWILYRLKMDNGNIFGLNLPWNEPHEDHEHLSFEIAGDVGDTMPVLKEHEDHDDEEHDEEHEEEDEE